MKFISADVSDMRIPALETYTLFLCDGCAQPQKAVVIRHEALVESLCGVRVGVTSAQVQLGKQAWPLESKVWTRLVIQIGADWFKVRGFFFVKCRQPLERGGTTARGALLMLLSQIRQQTRTPAQTWMARAGAACASRCCSWRHLPPRTSRPEVHP